MNMNEWIDVHSNLSNLLIVSITIHNSNELNSMNMNVTNLIISSNSCNELRGLYLDNYYLLKSIEIGNCCFRNVGTFEIDGLNHLKSIKIGENSFSMVTMTMHEDNYFGDDSSRSFSILNCKKLESIEIGGCSFCDYAGRFELKNLPKLAALKIGDIGSESNNFYYCSFVIKGIIDVILLMNRSSTFEFDWIRLWYF